MTLAAWLVSAVFAASELVIQVDRPCVLVVNMKPYPVERANGEVTISFPDGKEGLQRVMVRNLLTEVVWSGSVEVPVGYRVKGQVNGRTVRIDPPERYALRKMSERGVRQVDGDWVFGKPQAPTIAPRPRQEREADPFLEAIDDAATERDVGGVERDEPVVPVEGGVGTLALRNRSTSWTTVVVSGERHEFRGARERDLPLPSGAHTVEVRDVTNKLRFSGVVQVWPGEVTELHFSDSVPPAAPGRDGAFQADGAAP